MNIHLDAMKDRRSKQNALMPPAIDLEYFRRLANETAGVGQWEKKLEAATKGPASLTESEFFVFELYRPDVSLADIDSYVGTARQKALYKLFNSPYWLGVSEDKSILELMLKGAGLPVARTLAFYSQFARFGVGTALQNTRDLESFLTERSFPIFGKPVDGMYGLGAIRIDGFADGMLKLSGNFSASLEDFARYAREMSDNGYLFQECLRQHSSISSLFGSNICTIRILVANMGEPEAVAALIRTAGGRDTVDHRCIEIPQTVASIELRSGKLKNVSRETEYGTLAPAPVDPETQIQIEGFPLEHWDDAVELVLKAAKLMPLVRAQSWDVALTDRGPVILEFNWGGGLSLLQQVGRRGLVDDKFRQYMIQCENSPVYIHPIH